jgi:hypothetical protein
MILVIVIVIITEMVIFIMVITVVGASCSPVKAVLPLLLAFAA